MNTIQKEVSGIKQHCQRCCHEWIYTGTNPYVCTCPYCRTTVTINKKRFLKKLIDEVNK